MKIQLLPHTRRENTLPLRHGNVSWWLYKKLPEPFDITAGGLTIQDWSTRIMLLSLYAPRIFLAFKYRQHPIEITGREATIWFSQLALLLLQRSPYGFNKWVDPFMHPKLKVIPPKTGFLSGLRTGLAAWVNTHRIDANYLEFLKKAGIKLHTKNPDLSKAVKEASWFHLRANEMNTLVLYFEKLKKQLPSLEGEARRVQQKEIQNLNRFINRFTYLKGATFTISTLLISLVVGVWVNKFIFKFFAPFDKKFVPKTKLASNLDKLLADDQKPKARSA